MYFYFDFNDAEKQKAERAIKSLLFQLALQIPDCPHMLRKKYDRCSSGHSQPPIESVQSMLIDALVTSSQKYVVLDALDECGDRSALLPFLRTLMTSPQCQVRVLATSRLERDIEEELGGVADAAVDVQSAEVDKDIATYVHDRLRSDTKLKKWPQTVKDEIATELQSKSNGMFRWAHCQLESLRNCVKLSVLRRTLASLPKTLDATYTRIISQLESNEHFPDTVTLLRRLCFAQRPLDLMEVVDILAVQNGAEGCFDSDERMPDPEDVIGIGSSLISFHRYQLLDEDSIPTADYSSDGESFTRSQLEHLDTIFEAHRGKDEIELVENSVERHKEPIKPDEVESAKIDVEEKEPTDESSIQLTDDGFRNKDPFDRDEIPESMDRNDVQLAHFSVKEYLLSDRSCLRKALTARECYEVMAETCIRYLLDISEQGSSPDPYFLTMISFSTAFSRRFEREYPFVNHAASNWWKYTQQADGPLHGPTIELIRTLLTSQKSVWVWAKYADLRDGASSRQPLAPALYYASKLGFHEGVEILLSENVDVNACVSHPTALFMASEYGHQRVVELLLAKGAKINQLSSEGTALQAATQEGHEYIVEMLLTSGADPNIKGGWRGDYPLCAAARRGRERIVEMLLARGADLNVIGWCGTALFEASRYGYTQIVEMLLARGADVHLHKEQYGAALHGTVVGGNEQIIEMLVASGAIVDFQGRSGRTALLDACSKNALWAAESLVARGADVNRPSKGYGPPLLKAAGWDYSAGPRTPLVKMLLDNGADIDVCANVNHRIAEWGTALCVASAVNEVQVAELLLDRGANVHIKGEDGTALEIAVERGHDEIAELLRCHGADLAQQT